MTPPQTCIICDSKFNIRKKESIKRFLKRKYCSFGCAQVGLRRTMR